MTKHILIALCILCSFLGFSQVEGSEKSDAVDFVIIENPPVFPGCEKLDNKLQKMCLQNQIGKHVAKNFNAGLANTLGLEPGKTRLYVIFEISSDGTIKDVKASGKHKTLEDEGIRVIKLLPKMTPGSHKDKPVGVKYTIPITLMVDKKMEDRISDKVNLQYISDNIEKVIKKGESNLTNETTYDSIRKLGYKPKNKVKVITMFSVDNNGYVKDVRARGPHKIFEDEAIRIVKQLPKMSLAGKNNNGVNNKFTLPITIIIEKPKKKRKNK